MKFVRLVVVIDILLIREDMFFLKSIFFMMEMSFIVFVLRRIEVGVYF